MLPNLPKVTGTTSQSNIVPQQSTAVAKQKDALYDLVVDGDLGKLTPDQRVQYLKSVTESLGLNPMTRPFGLIRLDNKVTLYALKEASVQLAKRDHVTVKLGDYIYIKERNMLMVQATASSPDGRSTDDVAAIPLGEKVLGDAAANAYMKLATKAKRRVILAHCGLGILDETELDTIQNVRKIDDEKVKEIPATSPSRDSGKNEEPRATTIDTTASIEEKQPEPRNDREAVQADVGVAFDFNSNADRQWLLNEVRTRFPAIKREDTLQLCSTFTKETSKETVRNMLDARLGYEQGQLAKGQPSLLKKD